MNCYMFISLLWRDHIGSVMGDQVKHDYKISICYFSAKSVEIRRKSKDLLARNLCPSGATCLPTNYLSQLAL